MKNLIVKLSICALIISCSQSEKVEYTFDYINLKLEQDGIVEINSKEISDAERQKLIDMADDVIRFNTEEELKAFGAYLKGEKSLINSTPIGGNPDAIECPTDVILIEHAKIVEFLKRNNLLLDVEKNLTEPTFFTTTSIKKLVPEFDIQNFNKSEFKIFVDSKAKKELKSCGPKVCTPKNETCGKCHLYVTLLGDTITFTKYTHWIYKCQDNCSCFPDEKRAKKGC